MKPYLFAALLPADQVKAIAELKHYTGPMHDQELMRELFAAAVHQHRGRKLISAALAVHRPWECERKPRAR